MGKTTTLTRRLFSAALLPLAISGCLEQQVRPDAATAAMDTDPLLSATQTTAQPPAAQTEYLPPAAQLAMMPVDTLPAAPGGLWRIADRPAHACEPPYDLWARIRLGMTLPDRDHPGVETDLEWFAGHQAYLDRTVARATPYLHYVVEAVEARNMPTELALLPVVESAYQPFAYSHGRAAGLWQFIPGTGRRFDLKQSWWYDGRRDIAASTRAALDYLQYLHDEFDGDWLLALAAYNSGEGTVHRAVERNRKRGKPIDFWSLDLPRETRGYVPKLLAISKLVLEPEEYGVTLEPIPNEPYLAAVQLDSQIDLALAAELAGISVEEMYLYNPAFNRWATDPDGPHRLLLPVDAVAEFKQRLADYPPERRVHWDRYQVKSGESLLTLATRFHTTVDLLRQVNRLHSNLIRAGSTLTIPVARQQLASYSLTQDQRRLSVQNQPRDGRNKVEYEVQNGDTLWTIARRFDVGVNELAKWNAMAPRDPLAQGKRLVIWTKAPLQATASNPGSFSHPFPDAIRQRIGYTVRNGDSLAAISERFAVSVENLKRWNKLTGKKYLQPGQHLTLYVDVTHQAGNI